MKLTWKALRTVIGEELVREVHSDIDYAPEEYQNQTFGPDIDIGDLVSFAKKYAKMGWAVQEQLDDILDGRAAEVNPNAVDVIDEYLGMWHPEIDMAVAEARKLFADEMAAPEDEQERP